MASQQSVERKKEEVDYGKVVETDAFKSLLAVKKKFIVPITIFFFCFYLGLPILAGFTDILETEAIGSITWAWVYAFLQFIMTWALCMMYSKKANLFDEKADEILEEIEKERE